MRAAIKHFLRAMSRGALLASFLGMVVVGSVLLAATGGEELGETLLARGFIWIVVIALVAVGRLVDIARRHPVTVLTKRHKKILPALLPSCEEYCLLLRPFGYDGEILLPDLPPARLLDAPWWRRPGQPLLSRAKPVEHVIADVARGVSGRRAHTTFAIADQRMLLAPPGPTYLRARDDEWLDVAYRMISRAHTIVLLLPPDQPLDGGFAQELQIIEGLGRQSRVVIVLPEPGKLDRRGSCSAWHRACVLLALLRPASCRQSNIFERGAQGYQRWMDGSRALGLRSTSTDYCQRCVKLRIRSGAAVA
jgi:hypothetical protein